ncbi:MAG: lysophospholipid acyltransferase family protein [bacterium]
MNIKHYLEYLLVQIIASFIRILPLKAGYWLGERLGDLTYFLLPHYRKRTLDNLKTAFQTQLPSQGIEEIARQTYRNLGKNLIEFIHLPQFVEEGLGSRIIIEGWSHLEAARARGRGIIILMAHFGNWELIGSALPLKGCPLSTVVRRQKNKLTEDLIEAQRKKIGLTTISMKRASGEVLRRLKRGETVAMLADQDGGKGGVFVSFFDKPASTPPGPVIFAMRTGADILPLFVIRLPDNRHRIIIEKPYPLIQAGDRKQDILANVASLSKKLEEYIRRYPDQWFWLHNRWATRMKK